ncbi:potassium channel family protein [Hydrocarboniclastica marina]|uniref:Two pore domain potassium channel family protein n=1 Tax=Hydrocarboniclastica marina TaxID=2259620 RepID=A0A4P7XDM9_9ALTE|nr:potassium channel family protein [Hydrocarboniclastica marina]MAL99583.1 ion transporter [Alteromonadaceae bacterium]QCF25009.1 two pore domain potassium channel family protein [Hydrocarboniclastica marina]|tara:strand:- start:459 stop:1619 length:1161 start_codon:yes stop_codon:yes gene_type:complete
MLNRKSNLMIGDGHVGELPASRVVKGRIRRLLAILLFAVLLHMGLMVVLEGLPLLDAVWLSLTTLMTVGYGDITPVTLAGRLATILLIYVGAITIVALIVSDYVEFRFYRRERIRTGQWRFPMKNHIVFINAPQDGSVQYFSRVIRQLRATDEYRSTPVQILTSRFPQGLPRGLSDLGVTQYQGTGDNPEDLKSVYAADARHIIVLAYDEADPISDSLTFDIVHRLSEFQLASRVVVECVRDDNRERFGRLKVGSVLRPVRTYPEILVRALVAPGSEKVLEDLFNQENDHAHRYTVALKGLTWSDIVCALIRADYGTALAYISEDREVVCHPPANEEVTGIGLIVLVRTGTPPTDADMEQALELYRGFIRKWHGTEEKAPIAEISR